MANYLKPKRGRRSTAEEQNFILKRGEIFFECPETGQGTGTGRIKVGDGTTAYTSLPYFLDPDNFVSDISTSAVIFTETSETNNTTLLNRIVTGAALNTITASVKNLFVNIITDITQMKENFQDGVDSIYDACVAKGSTPASTSLSDVVDGIMAIPTGITPTGTIDISSNGVKDVTQYASANVNVPASAVTSGTYNYPSGSTGGTVDITQYKSVNASNVYAKGKADGGSGKVTISCAQVSTPTWDGTNDHTLTFSATPNYYYAIALGGENGYTSSFAAVSNCTIIAQYTNAYGDGNKRSSALCIIKATGSSVSVRYQGTWPYQGSGVIYRIAI